MRDAGLDVVRVTVPDLRRPELVVARIRSAHARALRLNQRSWTTVPPPDWPLELPLHDRLEQREAWEQWVASTRV